MQSVNIIREIEVKRTPRVMQLEGIFDVPPSKRSKEQWQVNLDLPEDWNVGLIVGPSGSGKTTIARELFGVSMIEAWDWPTDKSIVDGFPAEMSIKDIVALLSSVGFSSPPSWVRPFHVLSNGEQFRVTIARTLAEKPDLAVVDEFTSVVDRTVAKIGSAAIAKTVRRRNQKFIAVSCHYDIAEWLEPDWIYEPHTNELKRGRLRRPEIRLDVKRVHHSAWQLFRKHHYLDTNLNTAAICFCAFWEGKPVAFSAILQFPHWSFRGKREHRTVCLPDYQGVGIGAALSDYMGALCRGLELRFVSQTSHPAMINYRNKSDAWQLKESPTYKRALSPKSNMGSWFKSFRKRLTASFEYIGPALDKAEAQRIMNKVKVST